MFGGKKVGLGKGASMGKELEKERNLLHNA
jgi:hypothetical protein